ncbi:MAG: transcription termination/antitermination protein NusA [Chloroflexi bacterium]|nr:transcription termination/antitermination protein NusA [Chloroflexota bacterium]
MKSEFTLAFNEIAEHSKLKREVIIEALENALVSAYRREVNASTAQHVVAQVDMNTESFRIYAEKEVVEEVVDVRTEVALDDAQKVDPEIKLGDMITVESTPPKNFGRIAAQTAKQVILQRLRESERESQYQEYASREGDIIHGTVQSVSPQNVTLGLGRTEAVMPRNQQVPGERYRAHDKLRAYVLEVKKSSRGPQIIVSRTHKNMLRRLLENEVPEIYNGLVEIKSIAREPGHRSKVAVAALQEGVDPVGACVGMRGVRIQSIVKELNDEKIDVIEWNSDPAAFIAKSLSPARVSGVYLDDDPINGRTATVVVPDDQLSLAIGREGQNARLAAKLTNWRIDIKSVTEAAGETIKQLRANAGLSEKLMPQLDQAELTLTKKAEGKPIMPEEYTNLSKLVETHEKLQAQGRQAVRAEKAQKVAAIRATINPAAYQVKLQDSGLPDKIIKLLREGDYDTVGQVLEAMAIDEDRILGLEGFGPKSMEELKTGLAAVQMPEPESAPETPTKPEAVAEEMAEPAVAVAPAIEGEAAEAVVAGPEVEVEQTIEELIGDEDGEEEDATSPTGKKKKGKKKGKVTREVTYDEDLGVFVTTKKRKSSRLTGWGDPE